MIFHFEIYINTRGIVDKKADKLTLLSTMSSLTTFKITTITPSPI